MLRNTYLITVGIMLLLLIYSCQDDDSMIVGCSVEPCIEGLWSDNYPIAPYGSTIEYISSLLHMDGYDIVETSTIPNYSDDFSIAITSDLFKSRVLNELKLNLVIEEESTTLPEDVINIVNDPNLHKAANYNILMFENFITGLNQTSNELNNITFLVINKLREGGAIFYFNGEQPQGIPPLSGEIGSTHRNAGPLGEDIIIMSGDFKQSNGNNMMGTLINELLETTAITTKNRVSQLTDLYITNYYAILAGSYNFPTAIMDGSLIGILNTDQVVSVHLNGCLKSIESFLETANGERYLNDSRSEFADNGLNTLQESLEWAVRNRVGDEDQEMDDFAREVITTLFGRNPDLASFSGNYGVELMELIREDLHLMHDDITIREPINDYLNN